MMIVAYLATSTVKKIVIIRYSTSGGAPPAPTPSIFSSYTVYAAERRFLPWLTRFHHSKQTYDTVASATEVQFDYYSSWAKGCYEALHLLREEFY